MPDPALGEVLELLSGCAEESPLVMAGTGVPLVELSGCDVLTATVGAAGIGDEPDVAGASLPLPSRGVEAGVGVLAVEAVDPVDAEEVVVLAGVAGVSLAVGVVSGAVLPVDLELLVGAGEACVPLLCCGVGCSS